MSAISYEIKLKYRDVDDFEKVLDLFQTLANQGFKAFVKKWPNSEDLNVFKRDARGLKADLKVRKRGKTVTVLYECVPSQGIELDEMVDIMRALSPHQLVVEIFNSQADGDEPTRIDINPETYERFRAMDPIPAKEQKKLKRMREAKLYYFLETLFALNDMSLLRKLKDMDFDLVNEIEYNDFQPHTPLSIAATSGRPEAVAFLLEAGARVDYRRDSEDDIGVNAFRRACWAGNHAVVDLFIRRKLTPEIHSAGGLDMGAVGHAVDGFVCQKHYSDTEVARLKSLISELIEIGADPLPEIIGNAEHFYSDTEARDQIQEWEGRLWEEVLDLYVDLLRSNRSKRIP